MDVRRATLLMLLAASCQLVAAQNDSVLDEPQGQAPKDSKFLVLVDGQIVTGRVTPRPDGYDVQVAAGRMFIDSDRVRFQAASLPDAYDRMRDSILELTPASHLDLARWCLENRLHTQARREVLDALNLDPNREDARRMLRALEHVGERTNVRNTGTGLTEYASLAEFQRPEIESRSLAGLSRSIAHSFVRDVQPLLMNKCANSGCHGNGTKSQFQIVSTHRGSTPAIAERNLAAVLKQIDFSRPLKSPLLELSEKSHGNMPASAFQGRSGAIQMRVLQTWVMQAAHDIAPDAVVTLADPRSGATKISESQIQQVTAREESATSANLPRTMQNVSGNPHARQLTTGETDARFLRDAEYANRQDAFSPDEFNRRYHGSATKSTSIQSATASRQTESTNNENIDAQFP